MVLTTSDTISRNPNTATNPRLAARARISRETVVPLGFAFQIAFKAVCISPKTPDAVTIKVMTPMIVAITPEDVLLALRTAVQDLCCLLAHEAAQLLRNRVLSSIPTERESCDRNHNEQDRSDGRNGIEGNCSATAQGLVVDERENRFFQ